MSRQPVLLLLLVVAVGSGCGGAGSEVGSGGDVDRAIVADLAEALVDADSRVEPGLIDLGTYRGRPYLAHGWSYNERRGSSTFNWALGASSEVEFFWSRPRATTLELTGWSFVAPGKDPVEATLLLNGNEIDRLTMTPEPARYSVVLPAASLVAGTNRLEMQYSTHRRPEEGAEDGRRLAVAWSGLRFDDRRSPLPPAAAVGDGDLVLASGSRVDYYVQLPEEATMRLDGLSFRGASSTLRISLEPDQGATTVLLEQSSGNAAGLELALDAGQGPARLRIEVLPAVAVVSDDDPDRGRAADGQALLHRPRIEVLRGSEGAGPVEEERPTTPGRQPHIILYVVDTLRADHLGVYGYKAGTTPQIDAFAAESIVFDRAVAQSSWTKASMASIFTGLWPPEHATLDVEAVLPEGVPLLTDLLRAAGYRTGAVVANAYVTETFGFARGFDHFFFFPDRLSVLSDSIHAKALEWLDRVRADEPDAPIFLYVHTIDPHGPYQPPDEFRRRYAPQVENEDLGSIVTIASLKSGELVADERLREDLVALYDGDIAYNDHQFGLFLDELRSRGLYNDALIVFTSDHGEAFAEHGNWTHGLDLHAEVLRVPLIVRPPGSAGGARVTARAQHIDLLPTLLEASGAEPAATVLGGGEGGAESPLRGTSLLSLARSAEDEERPVFSHLAYFSERWVSVELRGWKLIRPLDAAPGFGEQLYDLAADPGETNDLASVRPVIAGYLATLIRRELRRSIPREAASTELDSATRDRLEALGYIE